MLQQTKLPMLFNRKIVGHVFSGRRIAFSDSRGDSFKISRNPYRHLPGYKRSIVLMSYWTPHPTYPDCGYHHKDAWRLLARQNKWRVVDGNASIQQDIKYMPAAFPIAKTLVWPL